MFILGLVSTYDAFLSTLLRSVFLTRPELISSSDRNISFKDRELRISQRLAREQMIEK